MTASKVGNTVVASVTVTAGSGVGSTSSGTLSRTTTYGSIVTGIVTNGGTGPTVGCTCQVDWSPDNSNWVNLATAVAGTTSSQSYTFNFGVPAPVPYFRITFGGNTGQDVTVVAYEAELTTL